MLAYCQNSPTTRYDPNGRAFLYSDILNRGLSGSAYSNIGGNATGVSTASPSGGPDGFALPFFGFFDKLFNYDSCYSGAGKAISKADDVIDIRKIATTGSSNDIGKMGERLARIDLKAKQAISVGGRMRIPDALSPTKLTEVKNVRYISNTLQLRDFADFAKSTNRTLELYVRPSTKIAKSVLEAGWDIKTLW